jgi:tetratricopeptide (TPR) repeat protein
MKTVFLTTVALVVLPWSVSAQQPVASAEATALRACVAHAERGQADSAAKVGKTAEALYRKRIATNPRDVEALVGAARALSQCLVPSANFISQGELSHDAMEMLEQVIELQPTHWLARYVLASIAYRSPAFLGRGKIAAQHFDELLRQQGDRTDDPMYARVFELRGMQLSRSGQADSARSLWTRGAKLFPNDSALSALLTKAGGPKPAAPDVSATTLQTVRVVATAAPTEAPVPSTRELPRSQIVTTAGGTADLFQAVQTQPGATHVSEGSDVYTRGGDAAETSLLVNGGRLLSLSRFEGLSGSMFGALEPFVVKSVKYSTGGFSVRHGNALSGIIDIETDGRPRERQMRAGLSLVQASGTMRLPAGKRIGGWVSGRASQTAALLATHGRTAEFDGSPHSEEVVASLIAAPSPMSEFRATTIVERDDSRRFVRAAGWRGPFHSAGDTRALILTSRWVSSSLPLTLRSSVTGSSRSSDWSFGVLSRERDERSALARVDAEWQATPFIVIRGGVEDGAFTRRDRGTLPTSPSVAVGSPMRELDDERTSANQHSGYTEGELTRGATVVVLGVRTDRLPGERDVTLDPRLAVSTRRGDWTARVSGGLFHQGRWRAEPAIPDRGTPSGLAREARHLILGLERDKSSSTLRAEAFIKRYDDYRAFGSGPQITASNVRGLDLLAQRRASSRMTGWLGYSYLHADATLADGQVVRSPFDITHSFTGSTTVTLNADWSIGTTARYGTGQPITPIVGGTTSTSGRVDPVYGAVTSERLPHYARLDARLMRFIRTPHFLLTTFVEALNLTNRHNVSGVSYDASYRSRESMHTFFATRTLVAGGEFQFR